MISLSLTSYHTRIRLFVIGDDLAVDEACEAPDKVVRLVFRYIDAVVERFDIHLCASDSSGIDRLVLICEQISGPLISIRKGHWRLTGTDRNCDYRS